jgi:hypothetical protein
MDFTSPAGVVMICTSQKVLSVPPPVVVATPTNPVGVRVPWAVVVDGIWYDVTPELQVYMMSPLLSS